MENCGDDYKIRRIKTWFKKCSDDYSLYLSTKKECVHDCTSELPYKYDNKCIADCKQTDKQYISFKNEYQTKIKCQEVGLIYDPDDLRCYLNCPDE